MIKNNETKYYPFFSSYLTVNCSMLFYGLVRENVTVEDTLYDVITLEAYVDDYVLAKTSLIVINSSEYDPYKLVYNVNGTEYVILNYFYFKLFLLIIVVIGILILVLEIREIVIKYRGKMYVHIDEQSNYI
ncbi:hypothetical protein NQ314_001325 [Rhamnusium bicolor]|uniref:Uncharacterized protein n=1 Tax=Rhamnusium bicolor TaxID=1586634 RepID=A0AAV8ZSD6_9CUCU|nr:hypothetical protein NQ314_001325 [Rhamnusium bicolor]